MIKITCTAKDVLRAKEIIDALMKITSNIKIKELPKPPEPKARS